MSNNCTNPPADSLLVGTMIGVDCDSNPIGAGAALATCQNLNDAKQEAQQAVDDLDFATHEEVDAVEEKADNAQRNATEALDKTIIRVDADGDKREIVLEDGTRIPFYITDEAQEPEPEPEPEPTKKCGYAGTGWYKDPDTGIVYSLGVPEGETHIFDGDPTEYVAYYDAREAALNFEVASTSNITNMDNAFDNLTEELKARYTETDQYGNVLIDLNHWDVSNVTSMNQMFLYLSEFRVLVETWQTCLVESFAYFADYAEITFVGLQNWDVSDAIDMTGMFYQWESSDITQESQTEGYELFDLTSWNTELIPTRPPNFSPLYRSSDPSFFLDKEPNWGANIDFDRYNPLKFTVEGYTNGAVNDEIIQIYTSGKYVGLRLYKIVNGARTLVGELVNHNSNEPLAISSSVLDSGTTYFEIDTADNELGFLNNSSANIIITQLGTHVETIDGDVTVQ